MISKLKCLVLALLCLTIFVEAEPQLSPHQDYCILYNAEGMYFKDEMAFYQMLYALRQETLAVLRQPLEEQAVWKEYLNFLDGTPIYYSSQLKNFTLEIHPFLQLFESCEKSPIFFEVIDLQNSKDVDLKSLLELLEISLNYSNYSEAPAEEQIKQLKKFYKTGICIVGKELETGKIIATALLCPKVSHIQFIDNEEKKEVLLWSIWNVGVHSNWVGQGLGRNLFDSIQHALGLDYALLEVDSENLPAIQLYTRAGFKHVGNNVEDGTLFHVMTRNFVDSKREFIEVK